MFHTLFAFVRRLLERKSRPEHRIVVYLEPPSEDYDYDRADDMDHETPYDPSDGDIYGH